MASRSLNRKEVSSRTERRSANIKATRPAPMKKNGTAEREAYIEKFITNSLKLQDELMVNREAIEAARREYAAEFQRKRQASQ